MKVLLNRDNGLQELAQSPLMLNIMVPTYQGIVIEEGFVVTTAEESKSSYSTIILTECLPIVGYLHITELRLKWILKVEANELYLKRITPDSKQCNGSLLFGLADCWAVLWADWWGEFWAV
ncbi:hypothetical protein [Candidatus Cyanaurora vandensis]|uniref:hypothetical protein n=1 Tax=Candidatus Cyanaurora vandensis TaxID=2714958 RepID=UPI00257AB6B6|nr:hypothetical protein [Candidatus Cyanaurora vandensis]